MTELSTEQHLKLRLFKDSVEKMTREEAQARLVALFKISINQDNYYKQSLGRKWGISK